MTPPDTGVMDARTVEQRIASGELKRVLTPLGKGVVVGALVGFGAALGYLIGRKRS
jgi:hypothetical protein